MSKTRRSWLQTLLVAAVSAALLLACASPPWAGMSETDIAAWKEAGFTAEKAQAWSGKGFTPQLAGEWGQKGFGLDAAVEWKSKVAGKGNLLPA